MPKTSSSQPPPRELSILIFAGNRGVTYFQEYTGPNPERNWRKPVVGPPSRPFAELQVVQRLEERGWKAAWVYRPGQYLSSWEPRGFVRFPPKALKLLESVEKRAGKKAGCWDVFAWRKGEPLFIEVKRAGSSDRLRDSQIRWKKAAIAEGVDPDSFRLVEWFGGDLRGRVLRLDFYLYDQLEGWAECRDGKLSFSDTGTRAVFQHYAGWGAASPADLLWLVYARNCDGVTWCGIKQRSVRYARAREANK